MSSKFKVQAGDTLWRIARSHDMSVQQLADANSITDPAKIRAGQELIIPDRFDQAKSTEHSPSHPTESLVSIREQRNSQRRRARATEARIDQGTGQVFAKLAGQEVEIGQTDTMFNAKLPKLLDDGRFVVWADRSSAGQSGGYGFENEGQSLRVYDATTGKVSTMMKEYFMVEDINSVELADGRRALVVEMSDGGAGFPHLAVLDPQRGGEVYRAERAEVRSIEGTKVRLGHFENHDQLDDGPDRYSTLDLETVINRDLIDNQPDWPPVSEVS